MRLGKIVEIKNEPKQPRRVSDMKVGDIAYVEQGAMKTRKQIWLVAPINKKKRGLFRFRIECVNPGKYTVEYPN